MAGIPLTEYHINLFWSDDDAVWIADIPDLESCSAQGPTPETAVAEVWLESARAHGDEIPPPHYRPAVYAAVS